MKDTTISLCMIVKNEERVLARCLDSLSDLVDEIIIVDTGSTDATKEIAAKYTDQIYDFNWQDDFSAARNFSFSKAHMDYIYAPDADEFLDEENRRQFRFLKEAIEPEIEIVQMHYNTVTEYNTVLNENMELRPKLFKRLREFVWIDPVHETVRLDPLVYDSDIVITHMPESLHSKRDFSIFTREVKRRGVLSEKLQKMYAMELYKTGDAADFAEAIYYFEELYDSATNEITRKRAGIILAKGYRLLDETERFFKVITKEIASDPTSEICMELGDYYSSDVKKDYKEASLWYYNAAYETEALLDADSMGEKAAEKYKFCHSLLKNEA